VKRRAWIQALVAQWAFVRGWAQAVTFPGNRAAALRALAAVVLPSTFGREYTDRIADRFAECVRGYRAGADMEHGYGFPRVRSEPPSAVAKYIEQLDALGEHASRDAVERILADAKITALPQSPNGAHIITDLMSFYFHSSEANDLCYQAQIQRDTCRGLVGSGEPPAPLAR